MVRRMPSALLRLVPHLGRSIGSAASCHTQQQWAAGLAAANLRNLHVQSQPQLHATSQPQPQPAISLQCFQPRRQFFSLPGSSPDLSKHYKERRLIG